MRQARLSFARALGLAAAVALASSAPRKALASPLELFGAGADSPGRGGTGVADCAGYDCLYLNPAGLAEARTRRFTMGGLAGNFTLEGVDRTVDAARAMQVGGVVPLPLGGWLRDRLGLAVSAVVPTETIARARSPMPGSPYHALLENRAQVVGLSLGLGLRLSPRWSVGAGVLVLAALEGAIAVSTDPAGRFTTTSEQELALDAAPILGVRFVAAPTLTLGLVYRGVSQSRYDITLTTDIADAVPITLPELRFAGAAQYDPMTVALEAAWRPTEALTLNAHLAWARWSGFDLPAENPVSSGMALPEPGFSDTLIPRLGLTWRHALGGGLDLALRTGGAWIMSPAPDDARSGLLDSDRVLGSVGAGLAAPTRGFPFHLDAFFQTQVLVPRMQDRGDAAAVETSGHILVFGLSLGVDL